MSGTFDVGREKLLQEKENLLLDANLVNKWATLFASLLVQQKLQLIKILSYESQNHFFISNNSYLSNTFLRGAVFYIYITI